MATVVWRERRREESMDEGNERQVFVGSVGQSGGSTEQNIHINQAPEPKLEYLKTVENKRTSDGTYLTRFRLAVDSPYAVGNLHVEAHAPSVKRASLIHQGIAMNVQDGHGPQMAFASIDK